MNVRSDIRSWPEWAAGQWFAELAAAPRSVLMLDYDGTLAPFAKERTEAKLYPGVAERLLGLNRAARVRLVFVSGRTARELRSLLPNELRVEIWGSHGRERLSPDGVYGLTALNERQLSGIGWFDRSLEESGFAAAIERKPGSLALHTRGMAAGRVAKLTAAVEALFARIEPPSGSGDGLEMMPFDGGIELRATGCTKAHAVECVLGEEQKETVVSYLGDDHTDEDAFRALEGHGLRVLVRSQVRPSAADLWLCPPGELLGFLDCWLRAASGSGSGAG